MFYLKIYLFFLVAFSCLVVSEEIKVIEVQTVGVGATQSEAVTDAQRNALKLSYQTFISSDLSILNNQIENEEVVSIVSGTIVDFKVLSTFEDDDGLWEANINATLTQDGLIRFAQAIGDAVKIQGSLFGAEIRQQNLNKENELVSIKHLIKKAKFFDDFFDASIKVGEPKYIKDDQYSITVNLSLTANDNFNQLFQVVFDTLKAVQMDDIEIEKYVAMARPLYRMTVCKNSDVKIKYNPRSQETYNVEARYLEKVQRSRKSRRARNSSETESSQTFCESFFLRHLESVRLLTGHNPNFPQYAGRTNMHFCNNPRSSGSREAITRGRCLHNNQSDSCRNINRSGNRSFIMQGAHLGLEGLVVNNLLNYPIKRMASTNTCHIVWNRLHDDLFRQFNQVIMPYHPNRRDDGGLAFVAMLETEGCSDGVILNACQEEGDDIISWNKLFPGKCESSRNELTNHFYSYNNSSPYRTKGGALPDQFGLISYCLPRKEWQRGKCYGRTKTYINLTNVLLFPAKGDFIASFDFVDAVSSEELLSITGYEVLTGSEVERIFKRAGNPKTTDYLSSCSW